MKRSTKGLSVGIRIDEKMGQEIEDLKSFYYHEMKVELTNSDIFRMALSDFYELRRNGFNSKA